MISSPGGVQRCLPGVGVLLLRHLGANHLDDALQLDDGRGGVLTRLPLRRRLLLRLRHRPPKALRGGIRTREQPPVSSDRKRARSRATPQNH